MDMEKQSILDDILYSTLRNKLIKNIITNIGKIKEEEDKIICYVEPKKFQRKFKKKYLVELYLNGMNAMNIDLRKIIEKLKLNKPVLKYNNVAKPAKHKGTIFTST